jgi:hypothetical protein
LECPFQFYSQDSAFWRRAKGKAWIEAEAAAWLHDHPGNPLPEHLCSLSDDEYRDYRRWLDTYKLRPRRRGKARTK